MSINTNINYELEYVVFVLFLRYYFTYINGIYIIIAWATICTSHNWYYFCYNILNNNYWFVHCACNYTQFMLINFQLLINKDIFNFELFWLWFIYLEINDWGSIMLRVSCFQNMGK